MSKLFGKKETFAIEILGASEGLIEANVFVAGCNITPNDNHHYDQFFVHAAIHETAKRLIHNLNWFKFNLESEGASVDEIFSSLINTDVSTDLQMFKWDPCTSGYFCALIPYFDKLYLCCSPYTTPKDVSFTEVLPYYLVRDLLDARAYAVSVSSNPLLKLE